jgi:hypothetical protein
MGRVMCEHHWLSVLMYTAGMKTLLLKNIYESKRSGVLIRVRSALPLGLLLADS